MTASRCRAAINLAAWTALLVTSMTWLARLPTAPASSSEGFDPAVTTMSIVRLVALVLGAYLLCVTALAFAVRLLRLPRAVTHAVERLAPAAVRSLVRAVVGVTLTTVVTTAPAFSSAASAAPVAGQSEAIDAPVLMHRLPDVDEVPPPAETTVGPERPAEGATRVVRPGDHFWSIAETELVAARGRPVRDVEVDPYWRQLVAANREVTVDPDLLVPGQVVHLPPAR